MKDWIEKLNSFLKFNERDILTNAVSISQEIAENLATAEYEKYNKRRLAIDEVAPIRAVTVEDANREFFNVEAGCLVYHTSNEECIVHLRRDPLMRVRRRL